MCVDFKAFETFQLSYFYQENKLLQQTLCFVKTPKANTILSWGQIMLDLSWLFFFQWFNLLSLLLECVCAGLKKYTQKICRDKEWSHPELDALAQLSWASGIIILTVVSDGNFPVENFWACSFSGNSYCYRK